MKALKAYFAPIAEAEANSAEDWYFEISPTLAASFSGDLEKAKNLAAHFPKLGKIVNERLRAYPLSRFPYFLVYHQRRTNILVVAVAHEKRGARYWTQLRKRG